MPLYDARKTVRYGAESSVLRSSLSILLTVLVTVCGGGLFRLMGQDVSCWAIADGHRVRKLCPLCVADLVDFKEKKDPAEQAGKPTRRCQIALLGYHPSDEKQENHHKVCLKTVKQAEPR